MKSFARNKCVRDLQRQFIPIWRSVGKGWRENTTNDIAARKARKRADCRLIAAFTSHFLVCSDRIIYDVRNAIRQFSSKKKHNHHRRTNAHKRETNTQIMHISVCLWYDCRNCHPSPLPYRHAATSHARNSRKTKILLPDHPCVAHAPRTAI